MCSTYNEYHHVVSQRSLHLQNVPNLRTKLAQANEAERNTSWSLPGLSKLSTAKNGQNKHANLEDTENNLNNLITKYAITCLSCLLSSIF
jgi:hypothetical protein